jgi:hypothetical protein
MTSIDKHFHHINLNNDDNSFIDQWDLYSNIITYETKYMTFIELIDTLQDIFIRYPFTKNYSVQHVAVNFITPTTSIQINKNTEVITIS